MNAFELRNKLISAYQNYVTSFFYIQEERIRDLVEREMQQGLLWPDPLIQLNPSFEPSETIDELVDSEILHEECRQIFRAGKSKTDIHEQGKTLRLHKHQADAIKIARQGHNYVLTTGTGSGKSLSYIIPIVDSVLRNGSGQGIKAIIVYPMNALANSQEGELEKFLCYGYPDGQGPVTFARYTGQEKDERRQEIIANPPDILITNYVMLELLLTRPQEKPLINAASGLRFLVFDEIHTYRGRQGADVAMLIRRAQNAFSAENMQHVGTSATLAGSGTYDEQRVEVAQVASMVFGASVMPEHVIGETLRRTTPDRNIEDEQFVEELKKRITNADLPVPEDFQGFIQDPLSIWIESIFGLTTEPETGRLIRTTPRSITGDDGAAKLLSNITDISVDKCVEAIEKQLLGSYYCEHNPETGFPVFAFRLHQFISRGDTVYASPESEEKRYITLYGQQYVPGDRERVLLPVVFCRECGQEYYCVRTGRDSETRNRYFIPREISDRISNEESEAGYLYINNSDPWPTEVEDIISRLPDDWLEEHRGSIRIKRNRRQDLPQAIRVSANGYENETGVNCHYIKAPFRFCLRCGVAYNFRQSSDFSKLATLGTEGRSTATTILSLAAIQYLRNDEQLLEQARKLLSFTDNRQDASLQAGHFNDFIEIGLLRSALYKAAVNAGPEGLRHEELVQKVFDALDLPIQFYASDPEVRYAQLQNTNRAFRDVLGYRIYRDLKRGWRIIAPNLEQCGLIEIKYPSLEELCSNDEEWQNHHPAISTASPSTRIEISKTLLDFMRRSLAIKVDYLEQLKQEQIKQLSSQRLREPWSIDDNEIMEYASTLYPRAKQQDDFWGNVFLSPRGGFGQYIRRNTTFPEYSDRLSLDETQVVCQQILETLRIAGLVEIVAEPRNDEDTPGYQVPADALIWVSGDGTKPFYDPIRIPRASETGGRTNPFFINFYKTIADEGKGLEAREHTAQVQYEIRINREERFREARLPILFCSPTMELGVDIAELNAVNLRNIPPTPANYAQRSGRAGRSGQPAIVFSYCSTYSSHDQYFFKRPELMVAGSVLPPRIDLANEDLIKAHIHGIWLSETSLSLGTSLKDILNLEGEDPSLELIDSVKDSISNDTFRTKALERSNNILSTIQDELEQADWHSANWLSEALTQVGLQFDRACERWRGLYRAAAMQRAYQHSIITDATRTQDERNRAKRLRAEAEAQIELLTEAQNVIEADFYSYRYFASEGFLPGYNFPRLPLSAYIPGRQRKGGHDEFLSRPRFLAVSEFGPRSIVYHEGARFRINRVILPVEGRDDGGEHTLTSSAKQCDNCGYIHPIRGECGQDNCERCNYSLDAPYQQLFRLQNVSTKRVDKINSDEEERLRIGYDIKTGLRFSEYDGQLSYRIAKIKRDDSDIATLTYGHAATLWRLNLGWKRRANPQQYGFVLDMERGFWARNQQDTEDDDQDPLSSLTRRVIPFVEDRKNCLQFEPAEALEPEVMASLQAAIKNAIQIEYQLEDSELAAEPMPDGDNRRIILFYEAAEGGAGVLRRLLDDSDALSRVAGRALELCHFDPDSGEDKKRSPRAQEDCEAACYDCLMSYSNQQDHRMLDRKKIFAYLNELKNARIEKSPGYLPRTEHLQQLLNQCQSELERSWLHFLEDRGLHLPSKAQYFISNCNARPDFIYTNSLTAVYIDGPHHDYPDRQERDSAQNDAMEDCGYTVLRFHHQDDWEEVVRSHPSIFGAL